MACTLLADNYASEIDKSLCCESIPFAFGIGLCTVHIALRSCTKNAIASATVDIARDTHKVNISIEYSQAWLMLYAQNVIEYSEYVKVPREKCA